MPESNGLHEVVKDQGLIAGWMLPNEGALKDSERRAAMKNFAEYLDRHGVSLPDVVEQIGTPRTATIRALLKANWHDNADKDIRNLNNWVEQHARRLKNSINSGFVTTTHIAQQIGMAARIVRDMGTLGLVFGPTGIGKTRCAEAVQQTTVGAIYIRVTNDNRLPKALVSALAGKLDGVTYGRQPGHSLFEKLIQRLCDSHRLLLIDEAHNLPRKSLDTLRDIHDLTGVPMLLIAVKDLHLRILQDAVPDRGQLHSRFGLFIDLVEGRDVFAGGKPLFSMEQIRELYQTTPIRLSKDAQEYLRDAANKLGEGSLRLCRILVQNAARRARLRQGLTDDDSVTVTAEDLEWVERHLKQTPSDQELIGLRRTVQVSAVAV